jgi:hypothetical protein
MGGVSSHALVEEFAQEREQSKTHNITEWDKVHDKSKNWGYYCGERICVIPKYLYPEYTQGYLFGYYENSTKKEP